MPSILIFESDLSFANELQAELVRRSCDVSIVEDASVGLQQAATAPPDLILLCTELPRMNGFSVCNRLKRDPELRQIPVIIMSANASEENFQQHRNLTNKRADDYVHKPISIPDMMTRVEQLVSLNGSAGSSSSELPELELGEVEDLDADELLVDEFVDELLEEPGHGSGTRHSVPAPSAPNSEAEMAEFADNAFDALIAPASLEPDEGPAESGTSNALSQSAPPKPLTSSPPTMNGSSMGAAFPPDAALPSSLPPPSSEGRFGDEGTRQAFVQTQAELANAKERLAELEDELLRAREADQKLEALYAELDDAKARLASGGGGKAREILDLREALNLKDKELLGLRDELTSKEKELLGTKDSALILERKTAEAEDRAVELEKRVASVERSEKAAQQDRDQAARRADTYKRKQEKLTEELTSVRTELDDLESTRQALATQVTSSRQALEQAETANGDLMARASQLASELEQANTALNEARSSLEQHQGELAQTKSELERAIAEQHTLTEQLASTQQKLNEASSARDELQERVGRSESRINVLESDRSTLQQELEALNAKLGSTEQQLDDSQLQAAEQGEKLDRYQVAAGELGGMLSDALNKLKELQPV